MKYFRADLHIHTSPSPCAGEEMTPPAIVAKSLKSGLDIIAITDHNTCGNAGAVMEAARGTGLKVLPGMEVQTREEIHLVCLFEHVEAAWCWQEVVYRHLPLKQNVESFFGSQLLLDARGKVIGKEERLLLQSTELGLQEVLRGVERCGGIVIPAHVDRESYSLVRVLGFIPRGLGVVALELSRSENRDRIRGYLPPYFEVSWVASSDAHFMEDIGRAVTCFYMQEPVLAEIRLALEGKGGRKVVMVQETGKDV